MEWIKNLENEGGLQYYSRVMYLESQLPTERPRTISSSVVCLDDMTIYVEIWRG